MRVAFSNMARKTCSSSPGEEPMTFSTSEVAACCSSAWLSSRVSRATSVSSAAGKNWDVYAFGALRRFGSGVFRRRPLVGSPTVLERRFIASPVGSGAS